MTNWVITFTRRDTSSVAMKGQGLISVMDLILYASGGEKMLITTTIASMFIGRLISEGIKPVELRPYIFRGPTSAAGSMLYDLYALYCTISIFTQMSILHFYPLIRRVIQPVELVNLFLYSAIIYALLIRIDAFSGTEFLADCQSRSGHVMIYFLDLTVLHFLAVLPFKSPFRAVWTIVAFLLKTHVIHSISLSLC